MSLVHASAVAFDGRGVLLTGPSGSGKSTLALQLIGQGGCLVADDQTIIEQRDGQLWMDAPDPLRGQIEARGLGLLKVESAPAFAQLVVDMSEAETARLPDLRKVTHENVSLPLIRKVESPAFVTMLRLYLFKGRIE